ncbi:MAG: hypothetical protein CENE_02437 [Candidatus Celerinatantimonas neptuna]|nr:MAG: hypothetical protein CENE_02437 [Candidatus Celerinatantimonas neptuna]
MESKVVKNVYLGVLSKTLFLLFGLLLLIFSGLIALNYYNIRSFFEVEQTTVVKQQQTFFNQYYADVHQRLQAMTRGIFAFHRTGIISKDKLKIWQQIRRDIDLPVRNMTILDQQNHLLAHEGRFPTNQHILDWFAQHPNHSKPLWLLDCSHVCQIYFRTTFTNVNHRFSAIYGLDSLKLFDAYPGDKKHRHMLIGIQTGGEIALLYTSIVINPSLGKLIHQMTAQKLRDGLQDFVTSDGVSELVSFQIKNTTSAMPVFYVQFRHIDGMIQHFRNFNRNNVLYGIGSMLLSMLFLGLLLRGPLLRIRRLTNCLPMLASSNHRQFRQVVAQNRNSCFIDETDNLGAVATQLSHQLERLERQLKSRACELEWIAGHDHLTQLPNRQEFERCVKLRFDEIQQGCLMVLDLDNFKYVNDISGQESGDQMLRQVARSLRRLLPSSTVISRVSGDQFGLFIDDLDSALVETTAQRINERIGQISVPGLHTIHTASVSIGIALYPEHDESFIGLMSKADICLFQAKNQGKHCAVIYHPDGKGGDLVQRHYWLDLAQHAISRNQMLLYYQPIRDNRSGEIRHYEVLLRVKEEDGQLISPYELILAAEKNGYISEIDLWVMQAAFDQLEDNLKYNHPDRLAINLSARSFASQSIINQIAYEFETRNIPGELIIFEITETAALPNIELARHHIQILKNLGCAIALDDFGVGYSSFHSLRELPLDYIKIDGSFIQDILENTKNRYFVRALCGIAHDLGHLTIAEFVENKALNDEILTLGVDYSQGYYVGKPVPAEQIWSTQRTAQVLSLRVN